MSDDRFVVGHDGSAGADIVSRRAEVAVSYRAVHGDAAANLIELSGAARMVVTGSRGLGGVAELLLGSVSDEVVVRRARCPVLVTNEPAKP